MSKRMLALGKTSLKKKQELLDIEYEAERRKVISTVKDAEKEKELLEKLEVWRINRGQELAQIEMETKRDNAFKTAEIALQTFSTLNNMGDKSSKANAVRAKAIIALEQAIAIARVWAAHAGIPFVGAGIAAAQTALYVAQFFAQSQAIDRAQQAAEQNKVDTRVVTQLGGGVSLEDSFKPLKSVGVGEAIGSWDSGGTGMGSGGGGEYSAVGSTYSGTTPSGGGGGTIVNVSIPQINVHVAVDTLEVADRRKILQALGDELRSETVESIRFAVTSANVANRNSQVAV
jgi:hypothetical protein